MYSVRRHSRRSSSSRNRTGKPYAAHLARLDYLLIYLPTQVQLTLTKIIRIVATRWRILRLKCTKFDFGCPDPAGGAYSAPPDPLAGFGGGPTSKERGREGRGGRGGEGRGRDERKGEGRGGEGKERAMSPPPHYLEEVYANLNHERARSASECSRFTTRPSFWPYLAAVKISRWYSNGSGIIMSTNKQTHTRLPIPILAAAGVGNSVGQHQRVTTKPFLRTIVSC